MCIRDRDYTDDGQGLSKPIRTRVDNNEIFSGFDRNANYYSYPMDAPYEIFNDKDIRMWATMIPVSYTHLDVYKRQVLIPLE